MRVRIVIMFIKRVNTVYEHLIKIYVKQLDSNISRFQKFLCFSTHNVLNLQSQNSYEAINISETHDIKSINLVKNSPGGIIYITLS